jgi:CheY-like chemotaxis protein
LVYPASIKRGPFMHGDNKILLVEDNLVIQGFHIYLLEKSGYQVTLVNTGQESIKAFSQNHYQAILMDIGLPDISGIEAIRAIRLQETQQQNSTAIPIIVLTAYDISEIEQQCQSLNVQAFMNKPISMHALNEILLKSQGSVLS